MTASKDNHGSLARRRARRRPADERREAILQAACRVFAAASYRSAGTVEIAREAGVGEPTLYRYFSDKKALYLGVLQRCRDHILTEWSRAGEGYPDPLEALNAMGAWYFQNARRDPDPLRVRARAAADSQESDTQELLREGYVRILEFVRDLLARAQRQGLIDEEVNVEGAAWLFMAVGQAIDLVTLLGMEEHFDDDVFGGIQRLFARALGPEGARDRPEGPALKARSLPASGRSTGR
jgi:AcrR family transcriptional regulator